MQVLAQSYVQGSAYALTVVGNRLTSQTTLLQILLLALGPLAPVQTILPVQLLAVQTMMVWAQEQQRERRRRMQVSQLLIQTILPPVLLELGHQTAKGQQLAGRQRVKGWEEERRRGTSRAALEQERRTRTTWGAIRVSSIGRVHAA